jgi:hypothetical protein
VSVPKRCQKPSRRVLPFARLSEHLVNCIDRIWWSIRNRFTESQVEAGAVVSLLAEKAVQSPTCDATHSKGWISLALMGNNKSWDRVSSTQLWRKFFKAVTNGIQILNHLRPDENELLLALPNSNKSKTTINCFCPISIQNHIRINPLLYCRDELGFEPLFTKHPDAIEGHGYHLKSLVGVIIDNSFEKWCHWNHSKECVNVLTRKFTSISVDKGSGVSPELLLLCRYANDAFKGQ